jgi:membrane protease YdiL (CAAX protease family)
MNRPVAQPRWPPDGPPPDGPPPEGSSPTGFDEDTSGQQLSRPQEPGSRLPFTDWPPWTSFAALVSAFALALFGGLLLDIPASLLGAHVTSTNVPSGLEIADTAVQDAAFVLAAVLFAHFGGRVVRASQFGLRHVRVRWVLALLAVPATYLAFFAFDVVWAALLNVTEKEKLLETLGANQGAALLILSAILTCVIAPACEEFLFRGFFFRALSNWRGTLPAALITGLVFGGVHAGSAPAIDLVPLAFLGFALCLLYRATGSLYPCIAVHALNNSIAFGSLEGWRWWQVLLLIAASQGLLLLVRLLLGRVGVIRDEPASGPPPLPQPA